MGTAEGEQGERAKRERLEWLLMITLGCIVLSVPVEAVLHKLGIDSRWAFLTIVPALLYFCYLLWRDASEEAAEEERN